MVRLVGPDNLSGGTGNSLGANIIYGYDTGHVAVESGTVTQLRVQIASIVNASSAVMVLTDMSGNVLCQTATFTPQTGWNNINVTSAASVTQGVSYILGLLMNGTLTPTSGTGTWELADPPSTFPTIPDPVNWTGAPWGGNHSQFNIYAEGTLASSAATLSAPTPSGTLETQTTATIGCTTDQGTGTLYVVVDSAANISGITAAQIKAGNNNANSSAVAANSGAISTTSPSLGVTGLTAGTLYSYAVVQTNDNGNSNVVTGTFTTAEAAAQEADGDGDFAVALSTAQAGTGQAAARKLRLTEANELELRSETGALITASGVNFEWYDKFGNTTGEPDVTGTVDIVNGEAVIPLFGSALSANDPGTLILYHPSVNTANGLYRLLVE